MAEAIKRKRKSSSNISKTDLLLNEMNRRKIACLKKLQKLSDRINVLEQFKKDTSGTKINLKKYPMIDVPYLIH